MNRIGTILIPLESNRAIGILLGLIFFFPLVGFAATRIEIVFLAIEQKIPAALSNLDPVVPDEGISGARLGIRDNNTTGQFTGQNFELTIIETPDLDSAVAAYQKQIAAGSNLFVTRLPQEAIRRIARIPDSEKSLILDISTMDDQLRTGLCRPGILYMRPSRAMRADALAQYMLKKKWRKWILIVGPMFEDRLYADAVRRAAKRYGMMLVQEHQWETMHDSRRTAQSEVPVLTQGSDYDVVVVADEQGLFGEYLPYRTWLPRPVIGSQGLIATAWDRSHEQWGAVQLQNRFKDSAHRWMREIDYVAWLAIRVVGEAATRTGSAEAEALIPYVRGPDFSIAGFKGEKLSFRRWNGQLRQPVLLAWAKSLVAVAPLEGFLHPKNQLDSLGYDESEVSCGDRLK